MCPTAYRAFPVVHFLRLCHLTLPIAYLLFGDDFGCILPTSSFLPIQFIQEFATALTSLEPEVADGLLITVG